MKRTYVATGLVAGLVAGAGAGFLLEQSGLASAASTVAAHSVMVTDDTTATGATSGTGDTTAPAASDSDDAAEVAGRGHRVAAALQPLIDDGTITQAQADAVIAALADAGPWRGGRHGRGAWWFAARIETVTTALGVTAEELHDALAAGSTLREIATAEGVDPQVVVDALVADAEEHLDEEVAEGDLTQAEADAALARVTTRVTELLDAPGLPRDWGRDGRSPGHHGAHDDAEGPHDEDVATTDPSTTDSSTPDSSTTDSSTTDSSTTDTAATGS